MRVVVGQVVGHPAGSGVQDRAAQFFSGHDLASGGLHQRWPPQEDGALFLDDDDLITHGGHVGATGRAGTEHRGDLADARSAHPRLIEEDPSEVVTIRKDLVLSGQKSSTGVDQIHAREAIVHRDLLSAQVLLHRHRVVRAALHRRVIRHDDHLATADAADPGDNASPRRRVVVHPVTGQRRQLQEWAGVINESVDSLTGQQFSPRNVAVANLLRSTQRALAESVAKFIN